jgi:hypothetical protein
LQRIFPLDILMVPSSALTVVANDECLSCGGFSLSETICFGSLEFTTDCFGDQSLSPRRDISDATMAGSTHSRPLSPLWAMIGDSIEEFHMALGREGGTPPLSKKAWHQGSIRPCHEHITTGEHSDHSSYDDDSTAAGLPFE